MYWIEKECWPKECFDQGAQNKKVLVLAYVIITTHTFLDLVYSMANRNSSYLISSLCVFIRGIIILVLWSANLLIAVIVSLFQDCIAF